MDVRLGDGNAINALERVRLSRAQQHHVALAADIFFSLYRQQEFSRGKIDDLIVKDHALSEFERCAKL